LTLDATCPVALLPVRLETRLDGTLLRLRIFPDELFADTHEPALTADERADGAAFLAAAPGGLPAEQEAWGRLVARWTAPRAAYIVRAVAAGATDERADTWTRAAQATLPDHWLVRAYAGADTFTLTSSAVRKPLALTLSPSATDADRVPLSDALSIDAALRWTADFAEAEAAGMAVTIDLTKPDQPPTAPAPQGVDRILVVGVDDATTAADGAARLGALLDAQHYTRGIAFMRAGTPTNNTPGVPVEFPPPDPGGAASFAVERGAPLVGAGSGAGLNGMLFSRAFGLAPDAVAHVAGAGDGGDAAAAAMNDALWPATFGYFMEQLMAPRYSTADIAAAREFWVDHVRPGGPLPALRVGRVPYGLLPAVSLDRQAGGAWIGTLTALRDTYFLPAVGGVPQIAAGSPDPDGDLLRVLAIDASARLARARVLLGQQVTTNTAGWLGTTIAAQEGGRQRLRAARAGALLSTLGQPATTRLGAIDPGPRDELVGGPLVSLEPASEEHGLEGADGSGFNYIAWLHDNAIAGFSAIRDDAPPFGARPLLYRLLRHALLIEMDRLAFARLLVEGLVTPGDRIESELVRLTPTETRLTTYDRIGRALADPGFAGRMAPYLARLATLAALPTAELERRFGETLDACSHRLDAWVTALAAQQLSALRDATPAGCHVGAFGWVENVRPADAGETPGGYVHAPSAAHAATAAVLRNGYLSRGGAGSAYDVDLGSARVRNAMELIDGTRQGEPLAALLGQRFERDLHARRIEVLIAPLRDRFPLVAGRTPEGDGPVALVAAANVVDGLALRAAWNAGAPPFGPAGGLLPLTSDQLAGLHAALGALDDAVDGVVDLLTAESVFQAVRGNPMAVAATLDTMGQGAQPPRPEVARTPLSGSSFTQRLAVVLDAGAIPATGAWGARTPRAAAEPFLDDWLASLVGAPADVGCAVRLPDGTARDVRADALGIRPLDLLMLARTPPSGLGDTELDRRVLDAAGAPAGARVEYGGDAPISFAQALELLRAAGELLAIARPLAPADLVAPGDPAAAPPALTPATDRAQAALEELAATKSALDAALAAPDPAALRAALIRTAALGVAGAYPASDADADALVGPAAAASVELAARQACAPSSADPGGAVQAAFGRDFLMLSAIVAPALDAPLGGPPLVDAKLPRQALQQLARVRPGVARWRALWLYGQALGHSAPALDVVQLPAASAWAGSPGASFAPGTLSLLLHRPTSAPAAQGWAGFVVDEWNETVPAAAQTTALAFRHEAPVAEAPQAVLLAVPPPGAASWDPEMLLDVVRETLDLAKLRGVDGSQLEALRPFLPAICLTGNTANDAISTDLLHAMVAEPRIEVA
jgi:hypothetical protein